MNKELFINYKKKKIKITAKNCGFFNKGVGLMFSRRENAKILLFDNLKIIDLPIHSYFIFYPFLAIWLNKENKVVDLKIVKPFSSYVAPKKRAHKLVEVPLNKKNKKIIAFFTTK
jgi:uncharacterized membrane protein (UPF0127 family)